MSTSNDKDDGKAKVKAGLIVLERDNQKIIVSTDPKGNYHKEAGVDETKMVITRILRAMKNGVKQGATMEEEEAFARGIEKNTDKLTAVLDKTDVIKILNDGLRKADDRTKKLMDDFQKLDGIALEKGTFVSK